MKKIVISFSLNHNINNKYFNINKLLIIIKINKLFLYFL